MRQLLAALFLLMLTPPAALAAGDHGFQLEVDAVSSLPFGTYEFGARATDLFGLGGLAGGKALFGLSRGLYVGAMVGYLRSQQDFTRQTILDARPPRTVSGTRTLTAIPVEAVGQLRTDTRRGLSCYAEAGIGVTSFSLRESNLSNGAAPASEFQVGLSFLLGAGVALGLNRNWELIGGIGYHQALTGGGKVWERDDNPAYALSSLGIRYPRW